eukprot:PhF_6_TR41991/c0_g1_i1/m.63508
MFQYNPSQIQIAPISPWVLIAGHAARITVYSAIVSVLRLLARRKDEKPKRRLQRRFHYAATETIALIIMCGPSAASVFLTVPRFLGDFINPRVASLLHMIDRYEMTAYFALAEEAIPLDNAVPYIAYVVTSIGVNLGLYYYTKKYQKRKKLPHWGPLTLAIIGQSVARLSAPSFVVSVPKDEA